ncbi:MAG: cytochrome P450 [Candidatus Sericytochromatia bacterium]
MNQTLTRQTQLPPGPNPLLRSESIPAFQSDPIRFLQRMTGEYGPICSFQLGLQRLVVVNEPRYVRQLLVQDYAQFKKGRFFELAKPFLGEGLLRSEGEFHAQQRRLIQPLFHRQRIQDYGLTMVDCAREWADRLVPGQNIDISAEMMKLTLRIAGLTLLDTDLEQEAAEIGAALKVMLNLFVLVNNPLKRAWSKLPTPLRREIEQAVATLDLAIATIIARQREQGAKRPNLIGHLMTLESGMSDRQIRDEALTMFLAGHETTANALAWTWYLLSRHPRVEATFRKELETVLGGRLPGPEDQARLPYTRMVLTEAMRLYPPAWILGRRNLNPYQLGDYSLATDTVFLMSSYLMHHDQRYYADPELFIPERWSAGFKEALPKFAYFPFGGGPRNCIGEAFAWMEGILMLATIGQRWRFAMVPDHPVALEPLVTLRPRYGLQMTPQGL